MKVSACLHIARLWSIIRTMCTVNRPPRPNSTCYKTSNVAAKMTVSVGWMLARRRADRRDVEPTSDQYRMKKYLTSPIPDKQINTGITKNTGTSAVFETIYSHDVIKTCSQILWRHQITEYIFYDFSIEFKPSYVMLFQITNVPQWTIKIVIFSPFS